MTRNEEYSLACSTADLLITILLRLDPFNRVRILKRVSDNFGPDGHTAQLPEKKGK